MTKKKARTKRAATKPKKRAKTKKTSRKPDEFIGKLKGKIRIVGDILSPIVPPEAWEYD
jgi:hypothetical protein